MSTGKYLRGIVAAVAAGVVLGVLFAPDKGSKTRKKIRRQAEDLKARLNGMVDGMAEEYEDVLEQSKNI
jgi:gas vesicle protein